MSDIARYMRRIFRIGILSAPAWPSLVTASFWGWLIWHPQGLEGEEGGRRSHDHAGRQDWRGGKGVSVCWKHWNFRCLAALECWTRSPTSPTALSLSLTAAASCRKVDHSKSKRREELSPQASHVTEAHLPIDNAADVMELLRFTQYILLYRLQHQPNLSCSVRQSQTRTWTGSNKKRETTLGRRQRTSKTILHFAMMLIKNNA